MCNQNIFISKVHSYTVHSSRQNIFPIHKGPNQYVPPRSLAIRDKLGVPFLLFFMAAATQSTLKRKTRRAPAAVPAIVATAVIAKLSPLSRPPRRESPLDWERRGSTCGRGMATGRRSLSASSAATAEPRGAPSLSLSVSCVRCLPASDVVVRRRGGEGDAAAISFFGFNPSKLKAGIWHNWVSCSERGWFSCSCVYFPDLRYWFAIIAR